MRNRKKWYLVYFTEPGKARDSDPIDAPDMEMARLWFMDNRHPDTVINRITFVQ